MNSFFLLGAFMTWFQPLWLLAAGLGVLVVALLALSGLLKLIVPKVAAIARATAKEAMSQPLFFIILTFGLAALIIFPFIPYNTFGEDVKMLKDSGLTLIILLSMVLALWTASVSVSEEIEGRTALTLLSKPIGRRQFIFGKFLGVVLPVAILFIVLGAVFLSTISYKVVYDARETSNPEPSSIQCQYEMLKTVPGLVLAFLEVVVLVSISVAISTRLPILPNLIICFAVYALGHLIPLLVESSVGQFELVRFFGLLLTAVLPVLDHFNVSASVATGQIVPLSYVAWAALYALLCSTAAILLALLLFEDRDLA